MPILTSLMLVLTMATNFMHGSDDDVKTMAEDPIIPNGYALVAYENCGAASSGTNCIGTHINLQPHTQGKFKDVEGDAGTYIQDSEQVEFNLVGLDSGHL